MTKLQKALGVGAATLALAMAGMAHATVYTFTQPGEASATVTTGTDSVTVVLTSLVANPTSDGSLLSDIELFFASSPGGTSLSSASGTVENIAAGGAVTSCGGCTVDHWGVVTQGDDVFLATVGTGSVGGKPHDLIIDGTGPYTNANASIFQHEPDIVGPGTFVIDFPNGVPTLTGAKFSFGTGPSSGDYSPPGGTVPEPATWAMMLMGVFGLGGLLRRRRHLALA